MGGGKGVGSRVTVLPALSNSHNKVGRGQPKQGGSRQKKLGGPTLSDKDVITAMTSLFLQSLLIIREREGMCPLGPPVATSLKSANYY